MASGKTVTFSDVYEKGKQTLSDFFSSPDMVKAKAAGKRVIRSIMSLDFKDLYDKAQDFFKEVQKTDTYKAIEEKAESVHNYLQENLSSEALEGKTDSVVGDYVGQLIGTNKNPKRPLPFIDYSDTGNTPSYENEGY